MRKANGHRVLAVLQAAPLFRGLAARPLHQLLAAARLEQYPPGATILREGTLGDAFYVVVRGRVAVRTSPLPGEATVLPTLGAGQYLIPLANSGGRRGGACARAVAQWRPVRPVHGAEAALGARHVATAPAVGSCP